jgi:hypothetical protein
MQQGKPPRSRFAPAVIACLVAVVLIGGCSSGDDESSTDTTAAASDSSGKSESEEGAPPEEGGGGGDPTSLTGVWEGTYECAQGPTSLRLTVDDPGDGNVLAAFEYFPTDGNMDVATGSYTMSGSKSQDTLALDGDEWLEQGGDYIMVGLEADLADRADSEALTGTVVGEGCTTFDVERVSTDPWYVGEWRGAYGCNQGVTGLTLTVDQSDAGDITAVFEFYAVPDNPGVPRGSFNMEGTYEGGTLSLVGTDWIDQPTGYVVVDYEANNERGIDPNKLYGTVLGEGCTLFTMDKVG